MAINKQTKIVCTLGPSSDNYDTILKMAEAGMNIVRLNFSHGTYEEHLQRINTVRQVEKDANINLGIMLDTKGPEIRLGTFANTTEVYKKGEEVIIQKADCEGTHERFTIQCKELFNDIQPGNYILVNDEDRQRYFKVTEFFRVRYAETRMYLLDYERTMDEIFEDTKTSYEDQAVMLGITGKEVNIYNSPDGNNVAFETGGRLYVYNISENRIAYIFGFYDTFTTDERMLNDSHAIKVMNIDEEGDVTFLVYGYMNRGNHEGECAICAYYYDASVNSVEELLCIPSPHAPDLLMKENQRMWM